MLERSVRRDAPTVAELVDRYWERHASKQKAARDVRRLRGVERALIEKLFTDTGGINLANEQDDAYNFLREVADILM